jgi:hypothetical protein
MRKRVFFSLIRREELGEQIGTLDAPTTQRGGRVRTFLLYHMF